jgi:Matrixin
VSARPLCVGLGLVLLAATRSASAYCPAMTCDPSSVAQNCKVDAHTGCVLSGQPLFWGPDCVTFSIQKDAAPKAGITYADVKASLERAFTTWTTAACDGGSPSLHFALSDPVSCDVSEYSKVEHNANIIIFREDEWPYEGSQDALGLTRVRFDIENNIGELFDTDIEINAVTEPLSVGEPKSNEVDLDSLITHEIGHALGLGHSLDVQATMVGGYATGSIGLRSLGDDDVAGICEIYPPGRKPTSTSCEPRHGFSPLCVADQPSADTPTAAGAPGDSGDSGEQPSSCAVAPSSGQAGVLGASLSIAAVLLAGTALARRRQLRGRAMR